MKNKYSEPIEAIINDKCETEENNKKVLDKLRIEKEQISTDVFKAKRAIADKIRGVCHLLDGEERIEFEKEGLTCEIVYKDNRCHKYTVGVFSIKDGQAGKVLDVKSYSEENKGYIVGEQASKLKKDSYNYALYLLSNGRDILYHGQFDVDFAHIKAIRACYEELKSIVNVLLKDKIDKEQHEVDEKKSYHTMVMKEVDNW